LVSEVNGKIYYIIWNPTNNRWSVYLDSEGTILYGGGEGASISSEIFQPIPTSGWQIYGSNDGSFSNVTVTTGSCPEYSPLSLNLYATNTTGFTALGSGCCEEDGLFNGMSSYAYFWQEEGAAAFNCRYLQGNDQSLLTQSLNASYGCSVRIVKD
jgi:hypothetical protein